MRTALRNAWPALLLAVMALVLRLQDLTGRGMWFWDEGIFLMGARFARWRLWGEQVGSALLGGSIGVPSYDVMQGFPGFPVSLWKPGYILLLAAVTEVFGDSYEVAQHLSAVAGALTVAVVVLVAKSLWGRAAGFVAGMLLAFNNYHLHYSRVALSESVGCLLATAAVGAFLLGARSWECRQPHLTRSWWLAAGVLWGAAFSVSYRALSLAPGFGLAGALILLWILLPQGEHRDATGSTPEPRFALGSLAPTVARLLLVPLGLVGVVLAIEPLHRTLYRGQFAQFERPSYLQSLQEKFAGETGFDTLDLGYYFQVFADFEGLFWVSLLCASLVWCLLSWRRDRVAFLLGLQVAVPFVLFSLTNQRLTRAMSLLVGLFCLVMAYLLHDLARWRSQAGAYRRLASYLFFGLIAATLVTGFRAPARKLPYMASGYEVALSWISDQQEGSRKHLSTMWPVTCYLTSKREAPRMPGSLPEFLALKQAGFRYLIVDWQFHLMPHPVAVAAREQLQPVFVTSNRYAEKTWVLGENHLPQDARALPGYDRTVGRILVYDLQPLQEVAFGFPGR